MKNYLEIIQRKIKSGNVEEAIELLDSALSGGSIPNEELEKIFTQVNDIKIKNITALHFSSIKENRMVPIIMDEVRKRKDDIGTLLYALEDLDCKDYFLDFVAILSSRTFEHREMAMNLVEKLIAENKISSDIKKDSLKALKNQLLGLDQVDDRQRYIQYAIKIIDK